MRHEITAGIHVAHIEQRKVLTISLNSS